MSLWLAWAVLAGAMEPENDALAGTSLGGTIDPSAWVVAPSGGFQRPATLVTISGTLTASMCGPVVGALDFRAGWTNAVDSSVLRTSGVTAGQSEARSTSLGAVAGAIVGDVLPTVVAVGSGRSTSSSSSSQDVRSGAVMIADAHDVRTPNPRDTVFEAFFLLSDAMKAKGWSGAIALGSSPDDRYQRRIFTHGSLRRVLDLACSTPDTLGLYRCEISLSTRDLGCADGI